MLHVRHVIGAIGAYLLAASATSATLTVNTTTTTRAVGTCSISRAIAYINAGGPGATDYCSSVGTYGIDDTIVFALSGTTPTITITDDGFNFLENPRLMKAVVIDGATGGAERVELVPGTGAVSPGLRIASSGVHVRNLVIRSFFGAQIDVQSAADGVSIAGSYIGTDASGVGATLRNSFGIRIDGASHVTIGGLTSAQRNIIGNSGNGGIIITNGADTIQVEGNYIGVGADGITAIGNCDGSSPTCGGIIVRDQASNITIGTPASANVISSNHGHGVIISGSGAMAGDDPTGVIISGNLIGVAADGSTAAGNIGSAGVNACGVKISVSSVDVVDNQVGGAAPGSGNVIANNEYCGVLATGGGLFGGLPTNSIYIESNAFRNNGTIGIDLSAALNGDAATANDTNGHMAGPNLYQNYPVATHVAKAANNRLYVTGSLTSLSTANAPVRIQVFANPPGQTQGSFYLGAIEAKTNASGVATFTNEGPFQAVAAAGDITLTAITQNGTSEMSHPLSSSATTDVIFANSFDTH
jgi:hypothetical protein